MKFTDMKKAGAALAAVALLASSASGLTVLADDPIETQTSDAGINFEADPTDISIVTPDEEELAEGAPSFFFGIHAAGFINTGANPFAAVVWDAEEETTLVDDDGNDVLDTPVVGVIDKRGTGAGWQLFVQQTTAFTGSTDAVLNDTLDSALITIGNVTAQVDKEGVQVPEDNTEITLFWDFGSPATTDEFGTAVAAVPAEAGPAQRLARAIVGVDGTLENLFNLNDVTLSLNETVLATTYSADLTWTLLNGPDAAFE
ncbi:MAG: WxL domain-containing protein [Turicibacter sp.]|nr:WxL domain-containing protein [Turicibacter sp.]